jgi:hypothetical protein
LFYLELPLNDSLPGDADTWANLAMFKELLVNIEDVFSNDYNGQFLYPADYTWIIYGLDFFSGIIWIIFYKLGFSEIWSYWLYISFLLALNSLGAFVFSQHFLLKKSSRYFFGLIFSIHYFVYLNIDNPNVLFYFFFFLSLNSLINWYKSSCNRDLFFFILTTSLQIYFSPVVFLFLFVCVGLLVFYYSIFHKKFNIIIKLFFAGIIIIFLTLPYLYSYLIILPSMDVAEGMIENKEFFYRYLSLSISDLVRIYPNNIFYNINSHLEYTFVSLKHLFPGFVLFAFFIGGLFFNKNRIFYFLYLFFFLLGCGRYIYYTDKLVVKSPFYFLFQNFGLEQFFRIPSRVNLILLLLSLAVSFVVLEKFSRKVIFVKKIYLLFIILIVIESATWNKKIYDSKSELDYSSNLNSYVFKKIPRTSVVLNLPTGLFDLHKDKREFLYMNNRFSQKVNIMNGIVAYFPESRMNMWEHFNNIHLTENLFCNYIINNNVSSVLVFVDWINLDDEQEQKQVNIALSSNCLKIDTTINNIVLLVRND